MSKTVAILLGITVGAVAALLFSVPRASSVQPFPGEDDDPVDEASRESFPASDSPAY